MRKFFVPFTLPGLNDYIEAERAHRQKGAAMKRKCQDAVMLSLKNQNKKPLCEPVKIGFVWIEKNRRRDPDNISSFGRKVILDAMVKLKILQNDGQKNISEFLGDKYAVNPKNPGIKIYIYEMGELQ